MKFILWVLFLHAVSCHFMKRSKRHDQFPDYSLRYRNPTLCDTNSHQVSGYFELPNGKNFFFWFIESLNDPANDPLVLWVNGGPGCSSLLGAFMGIGPCYIDDKGKHLEKNKDSWINHANVIFLDQPVKSGYSYNRNESYTVNDSNTASQDVYIFLQLFLKEFSKFSKSDLHIAGESYAGHFIPAFATQILQKQDIKLKSIMIGNGLTDPLTQYQYYQPMACEPSAYGTLLKSTEKCKQLKDSQAECQKFIKKCYAGSNQDCIVATGVCNSQVIQPILNAITVNMYDIRKECQDGPLCYNYFDAMKAYLDQPQIKRDLGVDPSIPFEICSNHVNADFQGSGDWMKPYIRDITTVLNSHISVLAYAGDADIMCNWKGIRAWTLDVPWYGKKEYNAQKDSPWYVQQRPVGEIRSAQNLTFLRIFEAGHMASFDQPKVLLEMFKNWILK